MVRKTKHNEAEVPASGSIAAEVTSPEGKAATSTRLAKANEPKQPTVKLLSAVLADFCEPLEKPQQKLVTETVQLVFDEQKRMIESALAIGQQLNKLRDSIGSDSFGIFATNVLPKMGIARSTAYKWMGKAAAGAHVFRNINARNYLYRLTDGSGIVDANTGVLSETAKKVLKSMPVPANDADAKTCELWANGFVSAVRKETASQRQAQTVDFDKLVERVVNGFDKLLESKASFPTIETALQSCWEHYLKSDIYRKQDAFHFAAKLDKLQNERGKQIEAASKGKSAEAAA